MIPRDRHQCFYFLGDLLDALKPPRPDVTEARRIIADIEPIARDHAIIETLPRVRTMLDAGDVIGAESALWSLCLPQCGASQRAAVRDNVGVML